MTERSQVEMFIETLAEALQADRDRRIVEMLNRQQINAHRYMARLSRDISNPGHPSERPWGTKRPAAGQMYNS